MHVLTTGLKLTYTEDYMDRRRIFTVDPDYFPMDRMREIVDYLHSNDQKYSAFKSESRLDID